jgi:hypothetical protein
LTDNTIFLRGDLRLFSIGRYLLPPPPLRDLRVA